LIDLYVSSFDWLVARAPAPHALPWFLAVTFCNGLVMEIGRKIRSPRDEEYGVETYSALWGRVRATIVWCCAMAATVSLAFVAASRVAFGSHAGPIFFAALAAAFVVAGLFLRRPVHATANLIETYSGAWTVVVYVSLGLLPFAVGAAP
jgi:hypothetical protein